jgi:acyl transferase domain-containing protein
VLFSFNGAHGAFAGMGADLFAGEPIFREMVERAAPVIREVTDYDVLPCFSDGVPASSKPNGHLLLGLLQFGQVELWRAAGVEPDATIGISLGEIGAVYAAGGLTLEDAARVLGALSVGLREGREPHTMFLIKAERSAAAALCEDSPVPLAVGGTLSADVVCLFCAADDASRAAGHIEARHRVLHRSQVERASHTPFASSVATAIE